MLMDESKTKNHKMCYRRLCFSSMAAVLSSHNVTAKAKRDKKTSFFFINYIKTNHIFIALWKCFLTFDTYKEELQNVLSV